MPITKQTEDGATRWTCEDVVGAYAVVRLLDGEIDVHLRRMHLDEEEACELCTALRVAFIEKGAKERIWAKK